MLRLPDRTKKPNNKRPTNNQLKYQRKQNRTTNKRSLPFYEFAKPNKAGIPTANNFMLHFVQIERAIPDYSKKPATEYLRKKHPKLAEYLTTKITEEYKKQINETGIVDAKKIFEKYAKLLYRAYTVMREQFSDEELFK